MGDSSRTGPQALTGRSRGLSGEVTLLGQDQVRHLLLTDPDLTGDEVVWIQDRLKTAPAATPDQRAAAGRALGVQLTAR